MAAGVALLIPLRGTAGLLLALLMIAPLWLAIGSGNVQPLIVAALLYGLPRRSGPLWLALAASLKGLPILFVLVYVGRGEWLRAGLSLVLTALLAAPILLYDLSSYPGGSERGSLPIWTWLLVGLGAAAIALLRPRWAALAAATGAAVLSPLQLIYNLTYLLAAIRPTSHVRPWAASRLTSRSASSIE